MVLSPAQIDIIKATVPVVQEHGDAITKLFYRDLLNEVPTLRNIFNHANQMQGHQSAALAGALYAYAANIGNLAPLKAAVEKIDQKHASLHIKPEQYDVVGTYLLRAMHGVLGDAFTPAILDTWAAAYTQLADLMIGREKQLYAEADGWTDWREFIIWKRIRESEDITSFYLKPVDGKPLPLFKPGQYISIQIDVPDIQYLQSRQYSLTGGPNSEYYRISVKREKGVAKGQPEAPAHPGYVSTIMHDCKNEGDLIQVSHPYGDFSLDLDMSAARPLVLLSAGVGLTPLVSMLETLVSRNYSGPVSFIHGTRSTQTQACGNHIKDVEHQHPNIDVKFFNHNPTDSDRQGVDYDFTGRLDLQRLDKTADLHLDDSSTEYYICGPETFMLDLQKGLIDLGVSRDRIKLELFSAGAAPRV